MRRVRAAVGDEIAIRLDANGAWSVREAIDTSTLSHGSALNAARNRYGILENERVARASAVAIAIDETADGGGGF